MRIAIISDIHGNLEALKATLKDIEKRKIDKIICLGDIIAKGVHPKECIELVRKKCEIVLQGNCDLYFSIEHNNINKMTEEEQKRIKWNQSLISKEDKEYLLNLPFCYEFYMSGSLVRLFHATPFINNKAILNVDSIETKYKMFLPTINTVSQNIADVVIYGHIHHSYMDKIYNKTIINVGSVGNPFDVIRNKDSNVLETTKSNYLIIEGEYGSKEYLSEISFQFIKVPYNIDKELKDESLNIEKENYRFELKEGMYRDMNKINDNFRRLGIDVEKRMQGKTDIEILKDNKLVVYDHSEASACAPENTKVAFEKEIEPFNDNVIYETENFVVAVPKVPHIPRTDGGHLWIRAKKKYFSSRIELEPKLAIEVIRLTMLLGEAMEKGMKNRGINIERINYQENGNWAYQKGMNPEFHIHLYGRTKDSTTQIWGEALVFPNKSTGFYDEFERFNNEDIEEIKRQINLLGKEDKYNFVNWKL